MSDKHLFFIPKIYGEGLEVFSREAIDFCDIRGVNLN
jgi:hypothetical protein